MEDFETLGSSHVSGSSVTISQESRKPTRRQLVYLELVLLVFGALVERPVVAELPDVVHFIEAFDVVGNALPLQHLLTLGNGRHSVDLQIWQPGVKERTWPGKQQGTLGSNRVFPFQWKSF